MPLRPGDAPEVQVSAVRVPAQVREGEPFPVEVVVDANHDDEGAIEVYRGPHRLKLPQERDRVKKGENRFRFTDSLAQERLATYTARVAGFRDTLRDNNSGCGLVYVSGKPRVLLIDGELARSGGHVRQVMLQRQGLFALGNPEVMKELEITDGQRQQVFEVLRDMQNKAEPLLKEAQNGGRPEEIGPKVMKLRQEHEGRIAALLSGTQEKQWKEMLGKPLDLAD